MSMETIQGWIRVVEEKVTVAQAKIDPIYHNVNEVDDTEPSLSKAKDEKAFDKLKSDCLADLLVAEKSVKPWQQAMDEWAAAVKNLETDATTEKEKIEQQQREADAVSKSIDDMNAQIQEYNDGLILGEADPRYRPLFLKKDTSTKLKSAKEAVNAAFAVAKDANRVWKENKESCAGAINEIKTLKDRISKLKFKNPGK